MDGDRSLVEEMLVQRAAQIAQERAEKGVGRTLAEDLARVTAAIRRLEASTTRRETTPR